MPGSSLLADYAANYGQRLRSMLGIGGQPTPQPSALAPQSQPMQDSGDAGMQPMDDGSMDQGGSALAQPQPVAPPGPDESAMQDSGDAGIQPAPTDGGSALDQSSQGKGLSFRDAWKKAPEQAKAQQLTKLEETLKRGNQTIDSAYDEMVKNLGAPPNKNRNLSRKEKGMLLMEFGLSMLANSRKGLATAAGQAGGDTLGAYQQMTQGPVDQYSKSRSAIEGARATDKAKLATQSALESVKQPAGAGSHLPGKFTGDDGYLYFYDDDGVAKRAKDESGNPIKAKPGTDGNGGHGFESDAKYDRYMEIYGKDPETGKPLTGLALEQAKQDALEFANDRSNKLDDLDLDIIAETSADKEMGSDAYRDLTPEQREERRNQIASSRRNRLKRPARSRLQTHPGSGEPSRGHSRGPTKSFASEADARAAFSRGEISVGDTIRVNGVEGPVE